MTDDIVVLTTGDYSDYSVDSIVVGVPESRIAELVAEAEKAVMAGPEPPSWSLSSTDRTLYSVLFGKWRESESTRLTALYGDIFRDYDNRNSWQFKIARHLIEQEVKNVGGRFIEPPQTVSLGR